MSVIRAFTSVKARIEEISVCLMSWREVKCVTAKSREVTL